MASMKILVTLLALAAICAITSAQASQGGPHTSQGGPHQNQGRIRRQATQDEPDVDQEEGNDADDRQMPSWTTCDYNPVGSKISCADCNTRLICKPVGGLLKTCQNPSRPYCNNGICSAIPSAECA